MKDVFSKRNVITAIVSLVIGILIASSCDGNRGNSPDKVKIKTRVIERVDTLIIEKKSKPKTVYIDKIKYIKGDVVYVGEPNDSVPTIKANKYSQKVVGSRSVADIEVTTTGELIDLKSFVTVKDSIIEKETIIIKSKSNVFMSGGISINPNQSVRDFNVGIDYNIKNKALIGVNGGFDLNSNQPYIGLRVGFSL